MPTFSTGCDYSKYWYLDALSLGEEVKVICTHPNTPDTLNLVDFTNLAINMEARVNGSDQDTDYWLITLPVKSINYPPFVCFVWPLAGDVTKVVIKFIPLDITKEHDEMVMADISKCTIEVFGEKPRYLN